MGTVRYFTFEGNTSLTPEFQIGLVKQALTAISFGAKVLGKGWADGAGNWKNPALVKSSKTNMKEIGFLRIRQLKHLPMSRKR